MIIASIYFDFVVVIALDAVTVDDDDGEVDDGAFCRFSCCFLSLQW